MIVIRLARFGRKNNPIYRLVVQEKHRQPKGKAIEYLGFYNPRLKEKNFKKERIEYWLSQGAQPSVTAYNFFVEEEIISGKKRRATTMHRKKKADNSAAKEEKASEATKQENKEPAGEQTPEKQAQPATKMTEVEPAKEEKSKTQEVEKQETNKAAEKESS